MNIASKYIVPVVLLLAVVLAFNRKGDAYGAFTRGAAGGLKTAMNVAPYIASMLTVVYLFRASGLAAILTDIVSPMMEKLGLDGDLFMFMLLRPLSGSGALALLSDICAECGADSISAKTAAVMMGSTETLFYTFALYFGAAKVSRTGRAMPCAIIATLAGYIASIVICLMVFR